MKEWADQYGVKSVGWVMGIQGIEGFVVCTQGGVMLKLKTLWWHEERVHRYRRWHSNEQRQFELDRRQRKLEVMQVQGCRAVHSTGVAC